MDMDCGEEMPPPPLKQDNPHPEHNDGPDHMDVDDGEENRQQPREGGASDVSEDDDEGTGVLTEVYNLAELGVDDIDEEGDAGGDVEGRPKEDDVRVLPGGRRAAAMELLPLPKDLYKTKTKLGEFCNMSKAKFQPWLKKLQQEPHFLVLKDECLDVHRKDREDAGLVAARSADKKKVFRALARGEAGGEKRYSSLLLDPDRRRQLDYNNIDYHAYWLYRALDTHWDQKSGALSHLTKERARDLLWHCLKRITYDNSPARKAEGRQERLRAKGRERDRERLQKHVSAALPAPPPTAKQGSKRVTSGKASSKDPSAGREPHAAGEASGPLALARVNDPLPEADDYYSDEDVDVGPLDFDWYKTFDDKDRAALLQEAREEDEKAMVSDMQQERPEPLKTNWQVSDLRPEYRLDKYVLSRAVSTGPFSFPKPKKGEDGDVAGADPHQEITEIMRPDPVAQMNRQHLFGNDGGEDIMRDVQQTTELVENEGTALARHQEEQASKDVDTLEDIIPISKPTDADVQSYNRYQGCLSSAAFQDDRYFKALKRFRIPLADARWPKVPGQQGRPSFWWQIMSAFQLLEIKESGHRMAFLADVVGLGKTATLITFMMALANDWWAEVTALKKAGKKICIPSLRPFIIVVPANLITQWAEELRGFSDLIEINIYHGDMRMESGILGAKAIRRQLTRGHRIFSWVPGSNKKRMVVVLTSYGVLISRHSPDYIKQLASANGDEYAQKFNLAGLWAGAVCDEAHLIKNPNSEGNVAVKALEADINVCASATPIVSHWRDFAGALKLGETREIVKRYRKTPYAVEAKPGKHDHRPNPYGATEVDGHQYRWVSKAYVDHLGRGTMEPTEGELSATAGIGARLAEVWRPIMVRHNYESSLPLPSVNTISRHLPECRSVVINVKIPDELMSLYYTLSGPFFRRLMKKAEVKGTTETRVEKNANSERALILLSTIPAIGLVKGAIASNQTKGYEGQQDLLWPLVDAVQRQHPDLVPVIASGKAVRQANTIQVVSFILKHSPRLSALVATLADQVHKRREKALVWAHYPVMVRIICAVLKALHFDVAPYTSGLSPQVRSELQTSFNSKGEAPAVLVLTYDLGGVGMNLQGACYRSHMFDPPRTDSERAQALGRLYRFGQFHAVLNIEYEVAGTYNERMLMQQIQRCLPELAARLDAEKMRELVGAGDEDGDLLDFDDDGYYRIQNVFWDPNQDNMIKHYSKAELEGMPLYVRESLGDPLPFEEVMIFLFKASRGDVIYQHGGVGGNYTTATPVKPKHEKDRAAPSASRPTPKAIKGKAKTTGDGSPRPSKKSKTTPAAQASARKRPTTRATTAAKREKDQRKNRKEPLSSKYVSESDDADDDDADDDDADDEEEQGGHDQHFTDRSRTIT